ncbi:MAG: glutathione S-transferase family protein [Polyangiaceae bacterium]|nr:glutathione S-transferase family protein [Polyangiaceae bacterium]
MPSLVLYVGNKNLSSWSLRPYLALAHIGVPFDHVVIALDTPSTAQQIAAVSPSGRVPALHDGNLIVWDSYAICEYLAERFPAAKLWPEDAETRATARSVSAEMHSGFADLRRELPMNITARTHVQPSVGAARDVRRILRIWSDCRAQFAASGPFLFGTFSIADAMFAPVVTRFVTYQLEVDGIAQQYMDAVLAMPAMREWIANAAAETSAR